MIGILEFFYNNVIIISIVALSLLATWILFRHTIKEFLFNRQLNNTQNTLRNFTSNLKAKRPSLRSIYKVFLPLLIPVVFILAVVRNPVVYDGHINTVNTEEDIINIYENFHSKYYSTSLYSDSDLSTQSIKEELYEQIVEFKGDYKHVLTHQDYLMIRHERSIEIIEYKNDTLTKETSIEISKEDEAVAVQGMVINQGNLIVLGTLEFDGTNEDYTPYTFVNVYNINNDFELVHEFEMQGAQSQISFTQNRLIVTTNQYLPFNDEAFDLKTHLPHVIHNEVKHEEPFDNIKHIEGSHPNNLFSIYHLEFSNFTYDVSTLLTDIDNQSTIQGNSVYLVNNAYEFRQISDYLELEDPVETYKSAISKFNISSQQAGIHYFRTKMFEGVLVENNGLLVDDLVTMAFVKSGSNDSQTIRALRFSPRLDIWHDTPMLDVSSIEKVSRHQNILAIEGEERLYGYNLSIPSQLNILSLRNFEYPNLNVLYQANNQSVTLSLEDDRIVIEKSLIDGEHVHDFSISKVTYRTNTLNQYLTTDDVYYRAYDGRVLIPHIVTTNAEEDDFKTAISVYTFEDERFIQAYELPLPKALHRLDPFIYRMHVRGSYIYHITPSGVAVVHNSDLEEIIDYIKID